MILALPSSAAAGATYLTLAVVAALLAAIVGCPAGLDWCAGGHLCSPTLRVHRSEPWTIRTRYGVIVATRVRHGGRDRLELRTVVELPSDQVAARRLSVRLLLAVDRVIRRIATAVRA
jgi:hypothetical protein